MVSGTRAVPYSTSPLALINSRRAFSAAGASARRPSAVLSSFAAVAWSLALRVAPVRAVTIASLALMPAWMASPGGGCVATGDEVVLCGC